MLELAIGALLLWLIVSFHWLRVAACTVLLALWGGFVIVGPLYLAGQALTDGKPFVALVTIAVSVPLAWFWFIAASAGRQWVGREIKGGRFWQAWNAR